MKAIYVDETNSSRLKRRLKTKGGLKEQSSSFELALTSTHTPHFFKITATGKT